MNAIDSQVTAAIRACYDRIARVYDRMTRGRERPMTPGRAALWQRVCGPRVLEVGVSTGKSMPYYLVVRLMGANINRETVQNVRRAGFADLQRETFWVGSSSAFPASKIAY